MLDFLYNFIFDYRFIFQLLIVEAAFVLRLPRRNFFVVRLLFSLAVTIAAQVIFVYFKVFDLDIRYFWLTQYVILFVLTIAAIHFCFEVGVIEALFCGTAGYALQNITFSITQIIKFYVPVSDWWLIFVEYFPYAVISVGAFLLFGHKTISICNDYQLRNTLVSLIVLIVVIFLNVMISPPVQSMAWSFVAGRICIILCCSISFLYQFDIIKQSEMKGETERLNLLLAKKADMMEMSKENIDLINFKYHDIKRQLDVLKKIDDSSVRREFIADMEQSLNVYENLAKTGNNIVDIVITDKKLSAEKNGISFSYIVDGKLLDFIDNLDLYVILDNILENAIEALGREDKDRFLFLKVFANNKMVVIYLENNCSHSLDFVNELPLSTKYDDAYHGFGLKSIRHILKKYKGIIKTDLENNTFKTNIIIPQQ